MKQFKREDLSERFLHMAFCGARCMEMAMEMSKADDTMPCKHGLQCGFSNHDVFIITNHELREVMRETYSKWHDAKQEPETETEGTTPNE